MLWHTSAASRNLVRWGTHFSVSVGYAARYTHLHSESHSALRATSARVPHRVAHDWSDTAAIELYYQENVMQEGLGDYIIKPGDPDYEDPDFLFRNAAELRFIADNFTSDDDEQIDDLLAYYRSGTKAQ
jgi:hypothetical protein